MPRFRSQDYWCSPCGLRENEIVELEGDQPPLRTCGGCGELMEPAIGAPSIRDSSSASYVSGTRRSDHFQRGKEINRLDRAAAALPVSERGAIRREQAAIADWTPGEGRGVKK